MEANLLKVVMEKEEQIKLLEQKLAIAVKALTAATKGSCPYTKPLAREALAKIEAVGK